MEVSKSQLKAKMLAYLRQVEDTGEELVVTDNGRPVVKVVAIAKARSAREVFADLRGRVVYHDDALAGTADEWPD